MKNTGQILKEKRESLNLTISEVALSTKINPKILAAMESGDQKNLPAQTFLKGFVRSYASYLKLDQEELIKSFNEEMGVALVEKNPEIKTEAAPQTRRSGVESESNSAAKSIAIGAIVVLIGIIFGVRELIEKYQKETVVEEPTNLKATPLPTVEEKVPEATAAVPEAPLPTAESIAAAVVPILPKNLNTKTMDEVKPVEPLPAEVKEAKEVKTVEVKSTEVKPTEIKPVEELKAVESKPIETNSAKLSKNEIILEALDKVDVRFDIKGETKKLSLAPTQVHTIRTEGPVQFDFSDGGAVNIIINGQERGVPGDLGKPKQVKIP